MKLTFLLINLHPLLLLFLNPNHLVLPRNKDPNAIIAKCLDILNKKHKYLTGYKKPSPIVHEISYFNIGEGPMQLTKSQYDHLITLLQN